MSNKINKTTVLRLFAYVVPPPHWRVPVIVTAAIFCGLGIYVLRISNFFSYLSDDPKVCMNCHVMTTQFATWERGNHGHAATCNDCHVPQDHAYRKYLFKAADGARHSTIFTLHLEDQSIRIKEAGINVVQENCIRCHSGTVAKLPVNHTGQKKELCWSCHRSTPHGTLNSLAAAQFARVPRLAHPIPNWLETLIKQEKLSQNSK